MTGDFTSVSLFNTSSGTSGMFFSLSLGMFIGSMLQLVFPFLTEAVVDVGIEDAGYWIYQYDPAGAIYALYKYQPGGSRLKVGWCFMSGPG